MSVVSFPVLYESDNLLIVDKPFDLLINSDDDNKKTLHHLLASTRPGVSSLRHGFHFIHRLDYATSGVICLGRNKHTAMRVGKLFENRSVLKYYLAIVRGYVQKEMLDVDIAIGYDKTHLEDNKKMCAEGLTCIKPRCSRTRLLVLQRGLYQDEPATKLLLKPLTGRRHQLRVHCKLLGHPIVGDYTYSDRQDTEPPRMFLHAYRLKVPMMEEPIDVRTIDPFTADTWPSWSVTETINDLSFQFGHMLFEKLENANDNLVITKGIIK